MGHMYVDSTIQGGNGVRKIIVNTSSTFTLLPAYVSRTCLD